MKKEVLKKELDRIESETGKGEYEVSSEKAINKLSRLNILYIKIINEANEQMVFYSIVLIALTIVLAILAIPPFLSAMKSFFVR